MQNYSPNYFSTGVHPPTKHEESKREHPLRPQAPLARRSRQAPSSHVLLQNQPPSHRAAEDLEAPAGICGARPRVSAAQSPGESPRPARPAHRRTLQPP